MEFELCDLGWDFRVPARARDKLVTLETQHPGPFERIGEAIMDDWPGYDLNLFTYPQHYYGDLEYALIPHGIIVNRIEHLAKDIMKEIGHCDIMVLCVLKGGYKFCMDLVEYLKNTGQNSDRFVSVKVDFIRVKSYRIVLKTFLFVCLAFSSPGEQKGNPVIDKLENNALKTG
ncbi:Phosphoribosyltransferase Domain-Containing Protein 1 [Manis pentadactyla]|nr:Phosphoribosyltransferase Domain-Containing Protein 1 [Manis pentadactyla]